MTDPAHEARRALESDILFVRRLAAFFSGTSLDERAIAAGLMGEETRLYTALRSGLAARFDIDRVMKCAYRYVEFATAPPRFPLVEKWPSKS